MSRMTCTGPLKRKDFYVLIFVGSDILPNVFIIPLLPFLFHAHFLQSLAFILMKHSILQKGKTWSKMKIQKRSESNVLGNLHSKKARLTTDGTHL